MNYSFTEKFTLVPKQMANAGYLNGIFDITQNESIGSLELEQYGAVLHFAAEKQDSTPLIYHLLQHLKEIKEHNKLSVSYNKENGVIFVAAAQGEKLLLANSYKAADFTTALYYITLVAQQVMFNPQLTMVNIYGKIGAGNEDLLNTYYKGIEYFS